MVDYLDNPAPEADLVLLGKKLGARERLLAAVKKSGEVHNFEQPTGALNWVGRRPREGSALTSPKMSRVASSSDAPVTSSASSPRWRSSPSTSRIGWRPGKT